jgi:hypothetical protein
MVQIMNLCSHIFNILPTMLATAFCFQLKSYGENRVSETKIRKSAITLDGKLFE